MANNKIGCSAGRTVLVDPNNFDGHDSSSNMSIPVEDLNISVQLTTYKKGRTVLFASTEANPVQNTDTVSVTFVGGSKNNDGTHSLTTKYTELTTIFDDNSSNSKDSTSETLGITNIDIDFNSSYAPMVVINFIDVRGSAIFQNEKNVANGKNNYSSFFQLPYPLFELTVKGYYGKPVKYCLHMTKFNAKFNSQTGNFEITANFIGYTYAMLSDMLIGYLKAIPNTDAGILAYSKKNAGRVTPVLKLNELMEKISSINVEIKKLAASDTNNDVIKISNTKLDIIANIQNMITTLASTQGLDVKGDIQNPPKQFIVVNSSPQPLTSVQQSTLPTSQQSFASALHTNVHQTNIVTPINNDTDPFVIYNNEVILAINKFNSYGGVQLTLSDLTPIKKYIGINKNIISPDYKGSDALSPEQENAIFSNLDNKSEIKNKIVLISNVLKNYTLKGLVDVYDIDIPTQKLQVANNQIQNNLNSASKALATTLKNNVTKNLGFVPTVRNIIEVFTSAVEAFMMSLFNVSLSAEKNNARTKELSQVIKNKSHSDLPTTTKFYPWPDYKEIDGSNGSYVEKYLGLANGLKTLGNVDELVFIDDLLEAFIKAEKESQQSSLDLISSQKNWIPVNPFDTRIFTNISPYKRISPKTPEEIYALILIRAMTFLGYTNNTSGLSQADIEAQIKPLAEAEANLILSDITSDNIKNILTGLNGPSLQKILNVKIQSPLFSLNNVSSNSFTNVINLSSGNYSYSFLSDSITGREALPISSYNIFGDWNMNLTDDLTSHGLVSRGDNDIFLTNYSNSSSSLKSLDGGKYVNILTTTQFKRYSTFELSSPVTTTSKLILSQLKSSTIKNPSNAGFNFFGGSYGVQEFNDIDWGDDALNSGNLPLSFVFYSNGNRNIDGFPSSVNGLALSRNSKKITTNYDLDSIVSQIIVPNFKNFKTDFIYGTTNKLHDKLGENRAFFSLVNNNNTTNVTYPFVNINVTNIFSLTDDSLYPTSLFGSKWYYGQLDAITPDSNGNLVSLTNYNQALLFLSTLPFNVNHASLSVGNTFEPPEIEHLFNVGGGFIHTPRLWCAYIGGLLWRGDSNSPITNNGQIINGGSGSVDPILWVSGTTAIAPGFINNNNSGFAVPQKNEYFNYLLTDGVNINPAKFTYHPFLTTMPIQAKNEFKRIFFEFVNGTTQSTTWRNIADNLEIWGGNTANGFISATNTLLSNVQFNVDGTGSLNKIFITGATGFINYNNYKIFTPMFLGNSTQQYPKILEGNIFLELTGDYNTSASKYSKGINPIKTLIDAMREELIIANAGYGVWSLGANTNNDFSAIQVNQPILETYINAMIDVFRKKESAPAVVEKQEKQQIFGTADENIIKFQLYRTCKNIYDKWLGGVTSEDNIIFQCGGNIKQNTRNNSDTLMANVLRGSNTTLRLIDSFRFLSRSFRDIGDDFYINPVPVNTYLRDNPNSSFYDAVSSLLGSNNFDFIALPSFIDYSDQSALQSMFSTVQYSDALKNGGICGPSFVCVYVGQKSKNLDFNGSQYTNDGFDIQCDSNGNVLNIPSDFVTSGMSYDGNVPVFAVNYSQQNQNIFKDIILDQNEFTETAESLQIVDDISKMSSEHNRTFAGQNMYNVYSVRSYKAEVEMMGNAMIQPMMYFQLNNIPMFHGAYMITHVKHSIKPNFMSTHFTGVRIRSAETPLLNAINMYQSLLDAVDISKSSAGSMLPIINTSLFSRALPDPKLISLKENPQGAKNGGFVNPCTVIGLISSPSSRDANGNISQDTGLEIKVNNGSNVVAIYDGIIEQIGVDVNNNGLYIVINHGQILGPQDGTNTTYTYKSVYSYLSDIDNNIKTKYNLSSMDLTNLNKSEINNLISIDGLKSNPAISIKRGESIGLSGGILKQKYLDKTNNLYDLAGNGSNAEHLHFELRIDDTNLGNYKNMQFVNPIPYLPIGLDGNYSKYKTFDDTQSDSDLYTIIAHPLEKQRQNILINDKTWI